MRDSADTYTGHQCQSGHTERYVSNGRCVQCSRVRNRDRYKRMDEETKQAFIRRAVEAKQRKHGPELIRVAIAGWGYRT